MHKNTRTSHWNVCTGGDVGEQSDVKQGPLSWAPPSSPGSRFTLPCSFCLTAQDAVLTTDGRGSGRQHPGPDRPCPPPPPSQVNPFRDRICKVFSHNNVFSFEDVLGMASVFSEQACPSLKIEYAFRIYGGYLGRGWG